MILILVKNKKYEDIPITELYFDNEEKLIKGVAELKKYNFQINYKLNPNKISNKLLKEITGLEINHYKNKEELFNYYKKNIEEKIL